MGQIYAVFRNTILETVRQPVYGLVITISCVIIATSPALAAHIYTFGAGSGLEKPAERMIADLGLATMLLSGLILAVFSTASVISKEVSNKTALTVLSKKVSRTAFVFGKYFGVATAITLATLTNTFMILLTIRMGAVVSVSDPLDWGVIIGMILVPLVAVLIATARNYFRGRPWIGAYTLSFIAGIFLIFCVFSMFDKNYTFVFIPADRIHSEEELASYEHEEKATTTYDWDIAKAAFLTIQAVLIMAGVSVAASTRVETGGNFLISAIVFIGGLTSEYFQGLSITHRWPLALQSLSKLWFTLVPNLQSFWMSDAITRERAIPFDYIMSVSAYSLCYIMAMLFLAAFLFQKREIS
ncbi:MAG: ABC transporter permease [Planctomycetes bacterium]|nr:ABC transporter permease [Planctomycetota bacterium]